jgi:hypothetical protein
MQAHEVSRVCLFEDLSSPDDFVFIEKRQTATECISIFLKVGSVICC